MTTSDARARFDAWTDALVARIAVRPEVVGLVLLGSGAERARLDEWSDHDFYLVVEPDVAEHYRQDLSWLPEGPDIVLSPRETGHGLKVVLADGHVMEFAVASLEDVATFAAHHWRVVHDTGPLTAVIESIAARTAREIAGRPAPDLLRAAGLFCSLLLIGIGRARRGELVAASAHVRMYALGELLDLVGALVPADPAALRDGLDPRRRVEDTFGPLGARIGAALELPVEGCARELLDIAETAVAPLLPGWPVEGAAVVRRTLDG
ncbi:hypothetical protein [Sanguibacter sp. HDW7]|uniref:hypothetical protein n=1 Tax=Sanguibacter sp. HDW7 TaxID=2714931 RepID=UPI00140C4D6F|nr:hypothetical protein [Sanguibacter sp. HDW7]QIK84780.1 hypothetical protein G7063_00005 [Sanguibacter sp. HDW7]